MSSSRLAQDRLRILGWWLLQMLLGALAAGIFILSFSWRVAWCSEGWKSSPVTFLVIAALLLPAIVRFGPIRLTLATFAFLVAGYASWLLYIGSALAGCD